MPSAGFKLVILASKPQTYALNLRLALCGVYVEEQTCFALLLCILVYL
jgi:hypothetical protein